jgi:hypothetical protein
MFDYQLYVSKCNSSFAEWEAYRLSFINKQEIVKEEEVVETSEEDIKKELRRRIKELGVNPNPKATLEQLQAKLLELNA